MKLLEVNHLKKVYTTRFVGIKVTALQDVSFDVEQGEYVAVMGESGSGKTTLLNILAALDRPTEGEVLLNGQNIVFQDFNLLDSFSLKDNIFLPLVLSGMKYEEMNRRLQPIARELGIYELLPKFPYEVSGGQKQRCAVARAIITDPQLILADEPTGALDSRSTEDLLDVFHRINVSGQTIVMVTHSIQAASHAGRVLFIKDGTVFHQLYRENCSNDEMYQRISEAQTRISMGGRLYE